MSPRKLNSIVRAPVGGHAKPTLLFVHGGYQDSRAWDQHFLPFFAAHGYPCVALDLSGHGQSEGREQLHNFGISDYVQDVVQAMHSCSSAPIVIGHSMGAAVVEEAVGESPALATVLMAPVPTIGTVDSIRRAVGAHPEFIGAMLRADSAKLVNDNLELFRDVFFTRDLPLKEVEQIAGLIQPESYTALTDLTMLAWRIRAPAEKIPTLVLSGEKDMLFPPALASFVATRWRTPLHVLPNTGHCIMMDAEWRSAAYLILNWLEFQQPFD